MIIDDNEGTFWTDTNGGRHYNERSIRILLHDIHGEYTGDLEKLPQLIQGDMDAIDAWCRASVIWDHYAVERLCSDLGSLSGVTSFPDAYGEQQAQKAWNMIDPTGSISKMLDTDMPTHLWLIEGRPNGLERAFDCLAEAMTVDYVGGDDDAFDYWPNTMDMLWAFAVDLDTIGLDPHKGRLLEIVRDLAVRVLDRSSKGRSGLFSQEQHDMLVDEWGRKDTWGGNL